MNIIKDEILKVAQEFNLNIEVLNEDMYQYVIQNVEAKFMGNSSGYPLWESIVNKSSVIDANAWKYLPKFIKDNTILFLEKEDFKFAIKFSQASHLMLLLENSFHFVFYITDLSFAYLLCFNDHDYLIGSGSAKDWIASLNNNDINTVL